MIYPRAMNNDEREGLKIVKESGLSHEIKYDYSPYSGGYTVNIPELIGTYKLRQIQGFSKDLVRYKENPKAYPDT